MRILAWIVSICFLSMVACGPVQAEDKKNDAPKTDKEKGAEYIRLMQSLKPIFDEKRFGEGANVCRKMIELMPSQGEAHYNLACCLAHLNKKDDALAALGKAVENNFTDVALIEKDDDLIPLRGDPRYTEILAKAKTKDEASAEKGEDIPGVKTVEASPADGLRYRLRMSPTATKQKPNRLIVWMHPSGGSMDSVVEELAPRFIKQGFALVVFTKKNYNSWSGEDASRLPKTLDALAAIEGISDDRPVLMGFSAGGQMALMLWNASGAGLGGLVLDAAYPVQMGDDGKYARMELPKDGAALKVPFFVLVGLADGGSQVWKQSEAPFKKAGTPLTINYIENGKHEWLFGNKELDALDKWLADLAAKPADAKTPHWRPK